MIRQIITAFSMYSAIPMPQIEWSEKNRRYALCFFPLVGVVIGAAEYALIRLCAAFDMPLLFAALAVSLPVLITGGIHLDGYCDVYDALSSCAPAEKALEIMHDPRIGAFAAIRLGIYLLVQAALFASVYTSDEKVITVVCTGFVMSRALSASAAYTFPSAGKGMLHSFTGSEDGKRRICAVLMVLLAVLCAAGMIYISLPSGIAAVIGAGAALIRYRLTSVKRFGGINGDMAGWFLQICEIYILFGAYIGYAVGGRL
ncbi:MAG: adenosylcobinamide-GDP ribazoletransferase [Oscillospiraceae bacterium]|nr:adenosylcobinamide-GDP ribazoletransferase [Oscillospiraceae bacterium]